MHIEDYSKYNYVIKIWEDQSRIRDPQIDNPRTVVEDTKWYRVMEIYGNHDWIILRLDICDVMQ